MEEYINQIERFLRGHMSLSEETTFKTTLSKDKELLSLAFMLVAILKNQEKTCNSK